MTHQLYLVMMFGSAVILALLLVLAFVGRSESGEVKSVTIWAMTIIAVAALVLTIYHHGILASIFGA